MGEVTSQNFGLLIAYVLPGFIALWGLSPFSITISTWLRGTETNTPTVGGFLYVTIASVGLGLIINALRWLTIEQIHNRTGISYPKWDFSRLQAQLDAYSTLVEFYYRYHEFFGNSLSAATLSYGSWRILHPTSQPWYDAGFIVLAALLWLASRDTLRKYYERSKSLLCEP